jgi:rhamnogalacturonan endolyase
MQVERLNRGLIAVRAGQGYYLSWRLLANEPYNTGFNVYRGTTRLNSAPITGATIFTDASAALNSNYTVRAIVGGVEQPASDPAIIINNVDGPNASNASNPTAGYIQIDLQRPPIGQHGGTYTPNDGSVGDLTGNGVYDIVLKWDPSNSQDNANNGITDNVIIDAYTLTSQHLWRIDLGPNIRAGAHYTQFMVYDFDGCGKAEIIMKTAPGTRDGTGNFISMGPAATANHNTIHRNSNGHIVSGPEYLTVFEGATGRELATVNYWPVAAPVSSWGGAGRDNGGNRVNRFNAVVAYLDGERPSVVYQRGYYERMTFAAWDWRNGQFTRRWVFDSDSSGNRSYAGQGNHSLSVADVDNSGRHSIITGSAVIGHDGRGRHTMGYGHGDALHVAHMIKDHPYPQIFMPHETGDIGVSLRHANNGQVLFTANNSGDVGRGAAAQLDAARPGFHFWGSGGMGLFNTNGTRVSTTLPNNGNNAGVCNFVIWWDGDLSRQLLDNNQITKWSIANNSGQRLLTATGASSNNGTKSTPVLTADIFGDWREEVIWRVGNDALRIYTTTMPTTRRLVTLMHDPVYRVAVAWQNSSYNQPPHPGYYIASDMDFPPPSLNVVVLGDPAPPPPPAWRYIGSGEFIDSLLLFDPSAANAANWSIQNNFGESVKAYGDRDFLTASVSTELRDAEWISPAANTRSLTSPDTIIRFRMKKTGAVYVAHEDRVSPRPAWIAARGFAETNLALSVNDITTTPPTDRPFTVYRRVFQQGQTVAMGRNSNDGTTTSLMYLVAVTDTLQQPTSVIDRAQAANYSLRVARVGNGGVIRINYSVKERGGVRLDLFDIKGSRVRTIVNSTRDAGAYHEHFSTDGLAAGVYLVRLGVGGRVLQERFLVAR